jgi:hypothetical protein
MTVQHLEVFCNMQNKNIYNENWKIPATRQQFSAREHFNYCVVMHPHSLEETLTLRQAVPVSLCPPQISHRLEWDRTQAYTVTDQKLTALATA